MAKFEDYFCEVQSFSDGALVLSGSFSKEEAATLFSEYTGEEITADGIDSERVRFGFAPENIVDMAGERCWYTGCENTRGSKEIWIVR